MPSFEQRPERSVEHTGAGLQKEVGAAFGPLHLLAFPSVPMMSGAK